MQCHLWLQASVCMQRGALRDLLRNPAIDIDIEMALIILKDICIAMKVSPEGKERNMSLQPHKPFLAGNILPFEIAMCKGNSVALQARICACPPDGTC